MTSVRREGKEVIIKFDNQRMAKIGEKQITKVMGLTKKPRILMALGKKMDKVIK